MKEFPRDEAAHSKDGRVSGNGGEGISPDVEKLLREEQHQRESEQAVS